MVMANSTNLGHGKNWDLEVRGSLENLSVPTTNNQPPENRAIQIYFVGLGGQVEIWSLGMNE